MNKKVSVLYLRKALAKYLEAIGEFSLAYTFALWIINGSSKSTQYYLLTLFVIGPIAWMLVAPPVRRWLHNSK